MKKFISLTLLVSSMLTIFLASCTKSDSKIKPPVSYSCSSCKTTPDAVAANDNSSKGIYKGVVVGSTGTIQFDIDNAGSTITAVMIIDGVKTTLTSTVTWTAGVAYVAPFTGTLNGQPITINFSVDKTGQSPTITSANIPGHPNASFDLIKETSTALVEGFEGTYSTSQPKTGTFDVILSRTLKLWGGVAHENGSDKVSEIGGTISGASLQDKSSGNIVGVLTGDQVDGKFTDKDGTIVTVTGKRTL